MPYDQTLSALTEKISSLEQVKIFQKAEAALRSETELFEAQEQMKQLQKDAILYKQIGKMQAYKETSHEAAKIEKRLKTNPLVEDYFAKLQDVNDLVQYVTGEIERKVNTALSADTEHSVSSDEK